MNVESIAVPEGRPLTFADFAGWFSRVRGGLGGRQHTVETAQDGQGQDDLAVCVALAGTAQQVADAPDERGDLGVRLDGYGGIVPGWE